MRVATEIYFAAGSVWAYGQAADANGQFCTVTRYDPQTLAKQADDPIPCAAQITSMGDAVWFVDLSKSDLNTGAGTVLTRIDPTTNAPGTSVPLPQSDGCCQASQGAIFCYCGNSDLWRLDRQRLRVCGSGQLQSDLSRWHRLLDGAARLKRKRGLRQRPRRSSRHRAVGRRSVWSAGMPTVSTSRASRPVRKPTTRSCASPPTGPRPSRSRSRQPMARTSTLTQLDYSTAFPWFATPRATCICGSSRKRPTARRRSGSSGRHCPEARRPRLAASRARCP